MVSQWTRRPSFNLPVGFIIVEEDAATPDLNETIQPHLQWAKLRFVHPSGEFTEFLYLFFRLIGDLSMQKLYSPKQNNDI